MVQVTHSASYACLYFMSLVRKKTLSSISKSNQTSTTFIKLIFSAIWYSYRYQQACSRGREVKAMDLKSIGASPPRFESRRLRFVSKGKHFFTAIYNNYDRQLLSLTVCCTCPLTSSLIVFFNKALCSLYFFASLFAFFPTKDPKPWIFRVFSSRRESGDCGSVADSLSSL